MSVCADVADRKCRLVWMCTDSWAKLKPFKVEATAHIMYKYLKSWDRGAAEVRE